jgi:hypothetical protein
MPGTDRDPLSSLPWIFHDPERAVHGFMRAAKLFGVSVEMVRRPGYWEVREQLPIDFTSDN